MDQLVIWIDEKTDRRLVYVKSWDYDHLECVTPDGVDLQVAWEDVIASTGFSRP